MTVELDDTATPDSDPARTHTRAASDLGVPAGGDLPPGLRLGHFRIDRKLGAGGMGEVYLATDLALDRPVAVKVLPSTAASGSARDRLVREARAQARIQHPNVAHIYFIGEDAGRLYFAMEYIAGTSLADKVAVGPLPVEQALAVIRGAVHGLREAQRSGFTHRDVKPSNLMVDAHGIVKVVDFGLVAAVPEHGDGPVEQTTLAGTPLYMAPEQARGEPIDLRADVYALGATLYHLVSGRPPFQAESVAELASLHATAARPTVPRGANPRTAVAAIDTLVTRMMAPDPADRFASYDELLNAIELASAQHSRPAGFWVRTIATGLDLLLAVLVIVLGQIVATRFGRDLDVAILPAAVALTTLAIGRWGTTPGKALFDLEVVATDSGRRPSWRQAIVRQLVLGGPTALFSAINAGLGDDPESGLQISIGGNGLFGALSLTFALIALVLLAYAAMGVAGKRAVWDRIAGTQVRYRTARRDAAALLP